MTINPASSTESGVAVAEGVRTGHHPAMLKAASRYLPPLAALFVLGPIAAYLVNLLRAPDGSRDATLLVGSSPVLGVVVLLGVFVIAGAAALLATHFHGWRSGMWTAGLTLAHAAWASGPVDMVIRREASPGVLTAFAVEGLMVGVLSAVLAAAVWLVAVRRYERSHDPHEAPDSAPRRPHPKNELLRAVMAPGALVGIGVAVVAGGAVAWLVAQEPIKGQAVFAAIFAGIVGAGFGRLASSYLDDAANSLTFFVALAVLAVVAPIAARFVHGDQLVADLYAGRFFGPAAPVGLDWAAGGFLGIPIGVSWFASLFERRRQARASA
ncbi:MAG TPA: hypothetical protein PLU35_05400 [Phycisphaerales bacterium]|nr:hypothetical protein [Phycisphaerales bacterium]